jgi:hypothetical protein
MQMNINYLTDNSGNKVAVQIPLNEWSELIEDYNRLKQYYDLKEILKESFREIEDIEKGEKSTPSLSEFLNES